jgi:hypothetical protein
MWWLWRLVRGGILRSHRPEALGLAAGLAGLVKALADWAVGDLSVFGLLKALSDNWALIGGGLGLATLGAKVERKRARPQPSEETVAAIAEKALRR